MDPQTEAEQFMDGKLSTLDQRWTELVSQVHRVPWSRFTCRRRTLHWPLSSAVPRLVNDGKACMGIKRNTGAYVLFHLSIPSIK